MENIDRHEYCPRCGTEMHRDRKPLHVRGVYVGTFAAMACPVCHYDYFLDTDYDLALRQALELGLVGPPFIGRSMVSTIEELRRSGFITLTSNVGRFRIENDKIVSPPVPNSTGPIDPEERQKRIVQAPIVVNVMGH